MGGENSTKNWKNEQGFIWWDFHVGSWRKMFLFILRCHSWDLGEIVLLQSVVKNVCLMEFDEKKSFEVDGNNDLGWENKWEVWVFILRKVFLTLPTLMEWKILRTQVKSSLLSKISSKLSLPGSSHSLQSQMVLYEAHMVENRGLYRRG